MGWIDKLAGSDRAGEKRRNLPALDLRGVKIPTNWLGEKTGPSEKLPNASIVYGIGAGGLLAFALYSFVMGAWFTAALLLLPAAALLFFALHFIRQPF